MPMPMEYWSASKDFEALLGDVREACSFGSHHQAYHTLRAVLHVFRAHVSVGDALTFAGILPPVVRAIFVEDWDANMPVTPFPARDVLAEEVKTVRRDHNFAPDTAIADVAGVLRRHINAEDLDRVLRSMPPPAAQYWAI
jgi:uncharacterized protein (DUF2267 family)